MSYRALTMPSFMDNLLRQVGAVRHEGVFFSPISDDRKLPTCATRDIAAVAARLLLDSSWSGVGSVPVLGPEDLSFNDMARIMSEVLGRPVRSSRSPPRPSGQRCSTRDVRDDGPGHGRHADRQEQGPRQRRAAHRRGPTPTSFRQWCEEVLKPAVTG